MSITSKLLCAAGLLVTGGEVITHGDEHAERIKVVLLDSRPDRGIQAVPLSDLDQLPEGIERLPN